MSQSSVVEIEGHSIERIDYKSQPVITFRMVDELHERASGTAKRAFNQNELRFIEGEDYFNVPYERWQALLVVRNSYHQKGGHRGPMTFLTQSGYLLLVKTFTDDRAWTVQRALINFYFIAKGRSLHERMWDSLAGDPARARDLRLSMKEERKFHEAARAEAERIIKGRGSVEALSHTPMVQAAVRNLVENDPRVKYGHLKGTHGGTGGRGAVVLVECMDVLAAEYLAGPGAFQREYRIAFEPVTDDDCLAKAIAFTVRTRDLYAALVRLSKNLGVAFPFKSVKALGVRQNFEISAFRSAGWGFKRKAKRIHGVYFHRFTKQLSVENAPHIDAGARPVCEVGS